MTVTNVSKLGVLALVGLLLIGSATVQAQEERSIWSYNNGAGSFARANSPGQWVENTHLGTVYTFTEVRRTGDFIELYDGARVLWIRLYHDACYIQHQGTNGRFNLLYYGNWVR